MSIFIVFFLTDNSLYMKNESHHFICSNIDEFQKFSWNPCLGLYIETAEFPEYEEAEIQLYHFRDHQIPVSIPQSKAKQQKFFTITLHYINVISNATYTNAHR